MDAYSAWDQAVRAASIFAVDPTGIGGVSLRAFAGPVRDRWLAILHELVPAGTPMRRVPNHIGDSRLLGGLDLPATLAAGKPIAQRGILAESDNGIVILAMAERMGAGAAARIAMALDTGEVSTEREGVVLRDRCRLGAVMLDEGIDENEGPPSALLDRMAFHLDLSAVSFENASQLAMFSREQIAAARVSLADVQIDKSVVTALCTAALSLGIDSLRASLLAVRVARVAAALDGRRTVSDEDAALAAGLVFSSRATMLPPAPAPDESDEEEPMPADENEANNDSSHEENQNEETNNDQSLIDQPLEDLVLEAAKSSIPTNLLAMLGAGSQRRRSKSSGRTGALHQSATRGRPIGARRAVPRGGARLNVLETLRAAAPWQRIRRAEAGDERASAGAMAPRRIHVRQEDFHVTRFKEHAETTIIFVVDASGSAALHRLAEAKGAVELLLADCYVRRDRVAVIAFRGREAEVLLPPTRSLVRAKRSLAGMPGGGGTPLAAAIDAATKLAEGALRRGETPTVVFMTDGRANIARDGSPGRTRADAESAAAARIMRAARVQSLLIDTSPQPQELGKNIAAEMGARYVPLPYADASVLSTMVRNSIDIA